MAASVAATALFCILGATHKYRGGHDPRDGATAAYQALTLDPGLHSDILQDLGGSRALVHRRPTYRPIREETAALGRPWDIDHVSAHPPTAFVLTLPVALMPVRWAMFSWAILMLLCLVVGFRAVGRSWLESVCLVPIALLWPPVAWSLGQFTIPIAMCLALAWRHRDRPMVGGAAVACAGIVKVVPIVALPLAIARGWRAGMMAFCGVGLFMLSMVALLNPAALIRFVTVAHFGSEASGRPDNTAVGAIIHPGLAGFLLIDLFLVILMIPALRSSTENIRWAAAAWLSVALLPVAWIYSLVPLGGSALGVVSRRRPVATGIIVAALLITTLAEPFGTASAHTIGMTTLFVGLAVFLSATVRRRTPQELQARGAALV